MGVTIKNNKKSRFQRDRQILADVLREEQLEDEMEMNMAAEAPPPVAPTASPNLYKNRSPRQNVQGQADDVQRRGEGLYNGYGFSQQGTPSQKRYDFDNNTPGAHFYKDLWRMGEENGSLPDIYDGVNFIASDRQRQLYGEPNQFGGVPYGPAFRLSEGLRMKSEMEENYYKRAFQQYLSDILFSYAENDYPLDNPVDEILWRLGY